MLLKNVSRKMSGKVRFTVSCIRVLYRVNVQLMQKVWKLSDTLYWLTYVIKDRSFWDALDPFIVVYTLYEVIQLGLSLKLQTL